MSITVFTILHFFEEIKTFIQQGCIELITSDSKNIVILQKIYISNKSFWINHQISILELFLKDHVTNIHRKKIH